MNKSLLHLLCMSVNTQRPFKRLQNGWYGWFHPQKALWSRLVSTHFIPCRGTSPSISAPCRPRPSSASAPPSSYPRGSGKDNSALLGENPSVLVGDAKKLEVGRVSAGEKKILVSRASWPCLMDFLHFQNNSEDRGDLKSPKGLLLCLMTPWSALVAEIWWVSLQTPRRGGGKKKRRFTTLNPWKKWIKPQTQKCLLRKTNTQQKKKP